MFNNHPTHCRGVLQEDMVTGKRESEWVTAKVLMDHEEALTHLENIESLTTEVGLCKTSVTAATVYPAI
jgi:hypothetical protein